MATKERLIVKTSYRDVLERMLRKRGVKAELAEKETIIRVLTTHIREKELL